MYYEWNEACGLGRSVLNLYNAKCYAIPVNQWTKSSFLFFSHQYSHNLCPFVKSQTSNRQPLRIITNGTSKTIDSAMSINHPILKTLISTPLMSLMYPLPPLPRIQKMLLILTVTTSCLETRKQVTTVWISIILITIIISMFLKWTIDFSDTKGGPEE